MSVSTISKVVAPVKGESLTDRKARLDAAFHAGDKATRQALMAHNGVRKAREEKGYGRAAMAKALKITPAEYWVGEFVLVPGSAECKALLNLIKALPSVKGDQAKAVVTSKPKAPKSATVAKPTASNADVKDLL